MRWKSLTKFVHWESPTNLVRWKSLTKLMHWESPTNLVHRKSLRKERLRESRNLGPHLFPSRMRERVQKARSKDVFHT